MESFRRLSQTHASIAGMRTNTVPTVGLKAMISTWDYFLDRLSESRIFWSDVTRSVDAILETWSCESFTADGQRYILHSPVESTS